MQPGRGARNVYVVIPALDEEGSVGRVLGDLPWEMLREVVVVDNGSRDRTAEEARRGGATVLREPERGYGAACLRGLAHLRETRRPAPEDVVVFLDADYSDHPEELPQVAGPVLAGEADVAIGARTAAKREPGAMLPQALFGNWLATRLIALFWGRRYTDLGPFRAASWGALEKVGMRDRNYGWTVELQIAALVHRLRVTEVPVSYRRRIGVSKVTGTVRGTVGAGAKILRLVLRHSLAGLRRRMEEGIRES